MAKLRKTKGNPSAHKSPIEEPNQQTCMASDFRKIFTEEESNGAGTPSDAKENAEDPRKIGDPILSRVQQHLLKLLNEEEPKTSDVKTYFMLLVASRKLDLAERKAMAEASEATEPTEEEKMEIVWDMFALPEDERERRRTEWRSRRVESCAEPASEDTLKEEAK